MELMINAMSVTELKLQIIKKITGIEDELVLEEIYRLVAIESELDAIYRLSDDERACVQVGIDDVKAGRVYSSEAADNMIKQWLKE